MSDGRDSRGVAASQGPNRRSFFYLLNILTAASALVFDGRGLHSYSDAVIFIATLCYLVVTLLFHDLFKPVHRNLSLLAACVSLAGCIPGLLRPFHLATSHISSIVFFGFYCLLIGYMILRSTFLPRIIGVLMAIGGLGWLTFFFTRFAGRLSPYNMIPGIVGEGLLTLRLLAKGVTSSAGTSSPARGLCPTKQLSLMANARRKCRRDC